MPTDKQRNMGTDDTGRINSGGFGSSKNRPRPDHGGEHGEKKATNADHDQKVAENRRRMLGDQEQRSNVAPKNSDPSPGSPDDVLDTSRGREGKDPDRERRSGDIVSGGEHSQFPGTQGGYDDRREENRPPEDDLSHLDRGRNDDLSDLDKRRDDVEPLK
jgi:hypothetical protein